MPPQSLHVCYREVSGHRAAGGRSKKVTSRETRGASAPSEYQLHFAVTDMLRRWFPAGEDRPSQIINGKRVSPESYPTASAAGRAACVDALPALRPFSSFFGGRCGPAD
jgi:hypothetical protein